MAKITSKAAAAAAAASRSSPDSPKNTKWNDEAHQALIGTLLDTMDLADTKWRANLDFMVGNLAERGHNFSREGIRFVHLFFSVCATTRIKQRSAVKISNYEHSAMPSVRDETRQRDLLEEIYFVLSSRQSLTQEDKDAVVEGMRSRGYATLSWNAIR
ncbi:hypothetical protein diail_9763 [Diaporthe ilicicola]|nr:hypothetical protein diail_9763 [Diaporthe ilicicola]